MRPITSAPGATRPRVIDHGQGLGLGWPRSQAWSTSGRPGADGAEVDALRVGVLGDVGDGPRVVRDSHAEGPRARLAQG